MLGAAGRRGPWIRTMVTGTRLEALLGKLRRALEERVNAEAAETLLREARAQETPDEIAQARRLARMMEDPRGKELTPAQRAANRLQAQLRCVGERGNARLKYWKVLASELRCGPGRCTAVVKAVLALHYMEHDPFAALRAT